MTINTYYFVDPFAQKQEPKRTKKEVYRLGNLWFEEVGGLLKPLIGAELEEVKKKFQYKKTVRSKPPKAIDPHKNYSPAEVATLLNISYDTAIRRMGKMKGTVDMGTKERRYKRGKKMLRISGKHLAEYLRKVQIE